jgi:hypothetical protein
LPFIGTWLESFVSTTPGLSWIPTGMGYNFYFGGTSLLILVGVAMDTVAQIEAQLVMRNYEGFLGRWRSPARAAHLILYGKNNSVDGCAWCRKRHAGALASRTLAFAADLDGRYFSRAQTRRHAARAGSSRYHGPGTTGSR